MIHFHFVFGGLQWQNTARTRQGQQLPNTCLSSPSRGLAPTPPGPKLQKTLHCDHYFNTLCATPPTPLLPLQMLFDQAKY